jgi:uroporphyrinogen-III synthase
MKRVVLLRPEPEASASAERACALGLQPLVAPLFAVEPLAWTPPDPAAFDALLLTSANAVRHGGASLNQFRHLPVHAVGPRTAAEARTRGLSVATVGDGGVAQVLAEIGPEQKLLHLCGAERAANPPGWDVTAVPVYRARALPRPAALDRIAGAVVLVHSPRAGSRLAELVGDTLKPQVRVAAISAAAAEAAGPNWQSVDSAAEPSDEALLALAVRLCDKQGHG